jgi:hypothetical protein
MVEQLDKKIIHRLNEWVQCHLPLEGEAAQMIERRQVRDLPRWRIEVTEH